MTEVPKYEPSNEPIEKESGGVEGIRSELVSAGFGTSTTWTEQGGSTKLQEKLMEAVSKFTTNQPAEGVISIKKLPDGGYEIVTYQK